MTIDEAKQSLDEWVKTGIPRGGFLEACLRNDLHDAVARADESSTRCLFLIMQHLFNDLPSACWGTPGRVHRWAVAHRAYARRTDGASPAEKAAASQAGQWLRENGGLP